MSTYEMHIVCTNMTSYQPIGHWQREAWGRVAECSAGCACTLLRFADKARVERNPASVHTAEGNLENCLKATVNPEIGGLTHLTRS